MTQRLNAFAMIGRLAPPRILRAVGAGPMARMGQVAPEGYRGNWNFPNFFYQPPGGMPAVGPGGGPCADPCVVDPAYQAYQMQQWQAACQGRQQIVNRARNARDMAGSPQEPLGTSSRDFGDGTIIAAGAPRTITVSPNTTMCLTALTVARGSAPFFMIDNISANGITIAGGSGSWPADSHSPDASCPCPPLPLPTLYQGGSISITVTNIGAEAHHFDANYWGIRGRNGMGFVPDFTTDGCL